MTKDSYDRYMKSDKGRSARERARKKYRETHADKLNEQTRAYRKTEKGKSDVSTGKKKMKERAKSRLIYLASRLPTCYFDFLEECSGCDKFTIIFKNENDPLNISRAEKGNNGFVTYYDERIIDKLIAEDRIIRTCRRHSSAITFNRYYYPTMNFDEIENLIIDKSFKNTYRAICT